MTNRLKVWVENGQIAVEVTDPNGNTFRTKSENGTLFWTQNAAIVSDPKYGRWAFTKYGSLFSIPTEIKQIYEADEKLFVHTIDGWMFAYDMRNGQIKQVSRK